METRLVKEVAVVLVKAERSLKVTTIAQRVNERGIRTTPAAVAAVLPTLLANRWARPGGRSGYYTSFNRVSLSIGKSSVVG